MSVDVAVLVLNFNGKEMLLRCLRGCQQLKTDGIRLRIVAIDNGSRDGSVAAVREQFPEVEIIANQENLGFAPAYSRAIEEVEAEWIGFLNNDAIPDPDWVLAALDAADKHKAACVGSRMLNAKGDKVDFAGSGMNFYGHGFQLHHGEPADQFRGTEGPMLFACGGAMLMRRDVFRAVGGFDDDYFAYFEDVDLGWRLNVLGHNVVYAPDSVVGHLHSATSAKLSWHHRLTWVERNGLRSVVKNYDDAHLARILPAAMALIAVRGTIDSGANAADYFFENGSRQFTDAAKPAGPVLTAPSRAGRMAELVRKHGPVEAATHVARKVREKAIATVPHNGTTPNQEVVNKVGFGRMVAIDAVAVDAKRLYERRRFVQENRKRPDSEVVALFVDPLRPSFPYPKMRQVQDQLVETMGIAELFQ